jgi:glycosyltransferase involved in cell wall biosynthesis
MAITRDVQDGSSRRRRICVIGSGWAFTSGISYYTCRLANALAARDDVCVILMRRLIPRRLYPGASRVDRPVNNLDYDAHVDVFNGVDWYSLWSLVKAVVFLRRHRPEVVVLQWWTGAVVHSYLVLAITARRLGATVLVEFHETQDTGESRLPFIGRYVRLMGSALFARCSGGVVHSDFDVQEVRAHYPLHHMPILVAPHGPFDHHVPATVEAGSDDVQDDSPFNVLFFGTIRPYKGLEHLVEAFDLLDDDVAVDMRVTVVGETWEGWTGPLEMIARSPRRDRITLVNRYVHDDEVAGFFGTADAVALPYTRSSASGPLHIAMAVGLPVVLTDVGGLRTAAQGYEGVQWVPPSDPEALRDALARLPAHRGERYTDPRSWDDTVAVYDKLLEAVRVQCG